MAFKEEGLGMLARGGIRLRGAAVIVALNALTAACQPEPASAGASTPAAPEREPSFSDHGQQAVYDKGRPLLADVRASLAAGALTTQGANDLGFKCASLRGDAKKLANEPDGLVQRFVADVTKTCGMDVPLAAANAEIAVIHSKRSSNTRANVHGECVGLKLAIGDIDTMYASNPDVAALAGEFAANCTAD